MNESHLPVDYEALRRLRKNHSRMFKLLILSMGLLFGGLVLGFLLPAQFSAWFSYVSTVGLLLCGVGLVLSYPFGNTPCPRCKKPYYVASGPLGFLCFVNLSNRNCVHCGLALDAEADIDSVKQ